MNGRAFGSAVRIGNQSISVCSESAGPYLNAVASAWTWAAVKLLKLDMEPTELIAFWIWLAERPRVSDEASVP